MKYVHSLLASKLKDTSSNLLNDPVWGKTELQRKIYWYVWVWSFMSVYEKNKNIELVTDSTGKKILCDILQLPYNSVKIHLDDLDQDFWFLGKIKAYSLQNEPFIHLDGDVVFQAYEPNNFINYKLFCQNTSSILSYAYRQIQSFLYANKHILRNIPTEFNFNPLEQSNKAYLSLNAGVFGGTDIDFIKEYCDKILNFFNDHQNKIFLSKFLEKNKQVLSYGDLNFEMRGIKTSTALFSFFEEFLPVLMLNQKYGNLNDLGVVLSSDKENTLEMLEDYKIQSKHLGYIHLMDIKEKFAYLDLNLDNKFSEDLIQIVDKIISIVSEKYPNYANIIEQQFEN